MHIILLSGGSGRRLWPLSNDIRSKQFLQIFPGEDGRHESMVQRMYRQIFSVDKEADVTIAASASQVSAIHSQLGEDVGICVEPCRRDTFPAIVLSAAYLRDMKGISEEETVVVCPVDPYVETDYFEAFKELDRLVKGGEAPLFLMGIEPSYPAEKYGYIIPADSKRISRVLTFREKPDAGAAKEYIARGALWNCGVFAFSLKYLLDLAHQRFCFTDYDDLYAQYEQLEKISFDYAVTEKETDIGVMRFMGKWEDLGTWDSLLKVMEEDSIGEVIRSNTCQNVHVLNELDVPILCMGLNNMIVSASPEGILVSDKKQSGNIKPYVEQLDQRIMFSEKSWGSFRILDIGEESLTIKVTLRPGHSMHYHSHDRRDEVWTVILGKGRTIVDGLEQSVKAGDVITMQAGCRHTIIADTELKVIEVQLGKEISVHDKRKFPLEK